jgi:hypothetical protein
MKQVLIDSFTTAFTLSGGTFIGATLGLLLILAFVSVKDWAIHLFQPRVGLPYSNFTLSDFWEVIRISLIAAGMLFGIIVLLILGVNTLGYIFSLI